MQPLAIDVSQFGTADGNADIIRRNLERRLPEVSPAFVSHDGHMVIVGSGPSLPQFVGEIRREREQGRPICAIKGAHDFLCEQGIEPDLFVSVEPRDRRENLKHANNHTTYMLASRVSPLVFDHLANRKVVMWHSWSVAEECKAFKGRMAIGGGTTSGLRAINLFYVLGYRNFILYGFDSCLAPDGVTKRFTGELTGKTIDVHVGGKEGPNSRKFICNYAMAQQAQDFLKTWNVMPDVHVEVKGDGLLAAIVAERIAKGLPA